MAEFLSAEWVTALDDVARASRSLAACAGDTPFVLEQRVSSPSGDVIVHHLLLAPDGARVLPGEASDPDVVLLTDLDTAVALARGAINAQRALETGVLSFHGDLATLTHRLDALRAIDDVFASVRSTTTFPSSGTPEPHR